MEVLSFDFDGRKWYFNDLTVGQVEIISELLHQSRSKIFEELIAEADTPQKTLRLTIKISDVIFEVKRSGNFSKLIAACVCSDEQEIEKMTKIFKKLPSEIGDKVIQYFFDGGWFRKIVITDFLAGEESSPTKSTPSEK